MQTVFTLMNNECQGSDIAIYVCELTRNVECSLRYACMFKAGRYCFVARNAADTNPSKIAQIVSVASEEAAELGTESINPCTI